MSNLHRIGNQLDFVLEGRGEGHATIAYHYKFVHVTVRIFQHKDIA